MKILECKRQGIYDIGFIDPYFVNETTLTYSPRDTKNKIVKTLRFHEHKREILIPYTFG